MRSERSEHASTLQRAHICAHLYRADMILSEAVDEVISWHICVLAGGAAGGVERGRVGYIVKP